MRRPICPDGQIDIFPPETMHQLFKHPEPAAPLPPLPFPRNDGVDSNRVAKILGCSRDVVRRMLLEGVIKNYCVTSEIASNERPRISYSSLLDFCDRLRLRHGIPPRPALREGRRPLDRDILPFPLDETISVNEVCEHLDLSITATMKRIDCGALVGYQLRHGAPWRIHRPSLVAYINGLRRNAKT